MANLQTSESSLIEKLKSEVRCCPQCNMEVRHPLVERCPRCFAALPRLELSCQGCYHRFQCPIAKQHQEDVSATS